MPRLVYKPSEKFYSALEQYIDSDHSEYYLKKLEEALRSPLTSYIENYLKRLGEALPPPLTSYIMGGEDKGMQAEGMLDKKAGTYLMPITSRLICIIYLLEDKPLTDLFAKYFPRPPVQLFKNFKIPRIIQKISIEIDEIMEKIGFDKIKKIEPFIIKLQRHIRMKKRHEEEKHRIALIHKDYLQTYHMLAEHFIQDANTPYKPKCDEKLSERIMATAKKVAAFSTVKHITSKKAIQNIFDDALYGRRTLIDLYLDFEPTSLMHCDILNGDANVACLGPQDIDPSANGGIIIEFDLPKLIQNKPSAFYKQRDLEYATDNKIRKVDLGKEEILFDHTGWVRCAEPEETYLKIMKSSEGRLKKIARAPKSSFISYNLEQIHEVLTLNFFRFIDKIEDSEDSTDQAYIDDFYKKASQLNDEELLVFLTALEKNMTDTAEFNFYGAHQIDFSTIINITARDKKYTLNLLETINELNKGNIAQLRQARITIPELFKSYRFLDYLLLQVKDSNARYYLDDLRNQCKTPNWVKYTPLVVPEEFKLCWKLDSKSDAYEQKQLTKERAATISESTDHITSTLTKHNKVSIVPLLNAITEEQAKSDQFNKELQTQRQQFDTLIDELEGFASYCGSLRHDTPPLCKSFIQGLKKDFAKIGKNFFSDEKISNKKKLKESFRLFKSNCESLLKKAEEHFKNKNKRSCRQCIYTFFKSESRAIQDEKNKQTQHSVRQELLKAKQVVSKIENIITDLPSICYITIR